MRQWMSGQPQGKRRGVTAVQSLKVWVGWGGGGHHPGSLATPLSLCLPSEHGPHPRPSGFPRDPLPLGFIRPSLSPVQSPAHVSLAGSLSTSVGQPFPASRMFSPQRCWRPGLGKSILGTFTSPPAERESSQSGT